MSQAGYTPIQLYYSTTAAAVPVNTNLADGELAINITDGKLYYKDNGGTVRLLASNATSAPVLSFQTSLSGLTPSTATTGVVTLAGTLGAASGGTGLTTLATGSLTYGAGTSPFSALAIGTAGQILTVNSGATAPQWSTLSGVAVTTFSAGTTGFTPSSATAGAVTLAGTLATTNGGTGLTSFTSGGVVYASSSSVLATGSALTFDGTNLGLGSSTINTYYNRTQQIYGTASSSLKLTNATAGTANTDGFDVALNGVDAFVINRESGPLYFGTNNTTQATIDSAGNLGLGVTPSAWSGFSGRPLQLGFGSLFTDSPSTIGLVGNAYYNGGWKYYGTGLASIYQQAGGAHFWYTAASGTAGNAVSFTQVFGINASGAFGVGSTPSFGTSGQVLTSGGSGAAPTWTTVSGGGGSPATPTVAGTVFGSMTAAGGTPFLTALGYNAGLNNTGTYNVFVGLGAGQLNTSGGDNVVVGVNALYSNLTGTGNTAVGRAALNTSTAGTNTAVGFFAGAEITTGAQNTAIGRYSGGSNSASTGTANTSVGNYAGYRFTSGNYNVAVGAESLQADTTGTGNTALGYQAGYTNTTNSYNTFIGYQAGKVTTGQNNTFVGLFSGTDVTSGTKNTIIGGYAGGTAPISATGSNFVVLSDGDGNIVASTKTAQTFALQGGTLSSGTGIAFPATQSGSPDANTLDDYEEGSFTGTLTGCTTSPTTTFYYVKVGRNVTLGVTTGITATSNSTACTITGMPATIRPLVSNICWSRAMNNSVYIFGMVVIDSAGVMTLYPDSDAGNFVASGQKGIAGSVYSYHLTN